MYLGVVNVVFVSIGAVKAAPKFDPRRSLLSGLPLAKRVVILNELACSVDANFTYE
jgi:hypothetical protein